MTDAVYNQNRTLLNPSPSSASADSSASSASASSSQSAPLTLANALDTNAYGQFQHPGGKFATGERQLGHAVKGGHSGHAKEAAEAKEINWGEAAPGAEPLLKTLAQHLQRNYPNFGKATAKESNKQLARDAAGGGVVGGTAGALGSSMTTLGGMGGTLGMQEVPLGTGGAMGGTLGMQGVPLGTGGAMGGTLGMQGTGGGIGSTGLITPQGLYGTGTGMGTGMGTGSGANGGAVEGLDGPSSINVTANGTGPSGFDSPGNSANQPTFTSTFSAAPGLTFTEQVSGTPGGGANGANGAGTSGQGGSSLMGTGAGNGTFGAGGSTFTGLGTGTGMGNGTIGAGGSSLMGMGTGNGTSGLSGISASALPSAGLVSNSNGALQSQQGGSPYNGFGNNEPGITSDLVNQPGVSWQTPNAANAELFSAKGPTASDVQQGDAGDCFLMSSLAGVAAQDPNLIKNNIQPAGSDPNTGANLFNVTLYYKGQPERVQVDDRLLTDQGQTAYGATPQDSANGKAELWPALYEKAFAEFADAHPDVMAVGGQPAQGTGYEALGNGGTSAAALQAITGQTPNVYQSPGDGSSTWSSTDLNGNPTGSTQGISNILESANAGDVVTSPTLQFQAFPLMSGYDQQSGSVKFPDGSVLTQDNNQFLQLHSPTGSLTTLPAGHEYTVMGMDPQTDNVLLRNPWGNNPSTNQVFNPTASSDASQNGVIQIPLAVYQKMFGSVNELPSSNAPTSSTPSGMQA